MGHHHFTLLICACICTPCLLSLCFSQIRVAPRVPASTHPSPQQPRIVVQYTFFCFGLG